MVGFQYRGNGYQPPTPRTAAPKNGVFIFCMLKNIKTVVFLHEEKKNSGSTIVLLRYFKVASGFTIVH